ncbi:MAG: hypothetical protein ACTHN5_13745 [Phycisphaerae bacterium]
MGYGRKKNRNEGWVEFRERNGGFLRGLGLPRAVFETEGAFREFLTTGRCEETGAALDGLSRAEIEALFLFVSRRFDWEAAEFTAWARRRQSEGC